MDRYNEETFFSPCREDWRDGYLIYIRNNLNLKLQKDYLPAELKDRYIEEWGYNIINSEIFYDWYYNIRIKEEFY